jgi:putative transposase
MKNTIEIRTARHCTFHLHVHLVFVTKYRRDVFTKEILENLCDIFSGICRDFEAEFVEFDGEDDHVHLLVNYPPKVAVSTLVNILKGVSSRMICRKKYPKEVMGRCPVVAFLLRRPSCGGAPIGIIRQYIEQQKTPH